MIAFPPFTGFVKTFVISCLVVYGLCLAGSFVSLGNLSLGEWIFLQLGFRPQDLLVGKIWQPLTWVFVHSLREPFHIIFNMLAFWMFGSLVEYQFGSRRFIGFCLYAALFCAACVLLLGLFDPGTWAGVTVGASGIVYAILVAVARIFPNQMVIFLIFPMKMKHLAMILIGINLLYPLMGTGAGVSYVAHLGGALFGWIYISAIRGSGGGRGGQAFDDLFQSVRDFWQKRKKRRHLRIVTPEERSRSSRWN